MIEKQKPEIALKKNATYDEWDPSMLKMNYTGFIDIFLRASFTEITLSLLHLISRNVNRVDPWDKLNISFIMSLFPPSSW